MSYLDWHVGMEVVCLKTGAWEPPHPTVPESDPVYGGRYTIRDIDVRDDGGVYIRLREIVNPKVRRNEAGELSEACYSAAHFRPVQKRKTDISIFTRLLTHPRVTIGEDA